MHKVKDAVSKFLHQSFLFASSNEADRSVSSTVHLVMTHPSLTLCLSVLQKRKRSTSTEVADDDEQRPSASTATDRTTTRDNRPAELSDDDDENMHDAISIEQTRVDDEHETKRRRTADYQHMISRSNIASVNRNNDDALSSRRVDFRVATTHTEPFLRQTKDSGRSNRLTSLRHNVHLTSSYRRFTPNYDPSQSPLFSNGTAVSDAPVTDLDDCSSLSRSRKRASRQTPRKQIRHPVGSQLITSWPLV